MNNKNLQIRQVCANYNNRSRQYLYNYSYKRQQNKNRIVSDEYLINNFSRIESDLF